MQELLLSGRLKMDQKLIQILLILLIHPKISSAAEDTVPEEGKPFSIHCKPSESGTIIFLFRVVDESGMEFLGSFSPNGQPKKTRPNFDTHFSSKKLNDDFVLTVKSFNKSNDNGMYSCASLVKGNELKFGSVTPHRVPEKTIKAIPIPTTKANEVRTTSQTSTTPRSCLCPDRKNLGSSMSCAPIILGPLAGGCGLLLLLLIITILYCNKIRTRRCPHHHKRKMRMMAPEKQMITNRHF
ncbi:T-cell surface glycoprotein CD8 alpha chain isoform X2 [Girardinichthys multiradiatus]|uniref:T-cell surface glycoprotein CD8 alpha chain isoform X2 n=1 Tax=Girardinichthys multiradiatus TaxID=208333 RepID=UPI001FAC3554|nr:T-cell surface glycoprotein CD8 alpha chain isoform X2 [Girardinichthys multiradiatus]